MRLGKLMHWNETKKKKKRTAKNGRPHVSAPVLPIIVQSRCLRFLVKFDFVVSLLVNTMRESEATRKFLEVVGDTIRIRRLTRLSTLLAFHLDSTRFRRTPYFTTDWCTDVVISRRIRILSPTTSSRTECSRCLCDALIVLTRIDTNLTKNRQQRDSTIDNQLTSDGMTDEAARFQTTRGVPIKTTVEKRTSKRRRATCL